MLVGRDPIPEEATMIDPTVEEGHAGSPPATPTAPGDPILRPEARVVRADRSLAAMVLVICTLGGMGVGFGFAMYLMRAQLAYAPFSERFYTGSATPLLGVWYDPSCALHGARIVHTVRGTGADIAGIAPGDVITALDGRDFRLGCDLSSVVQQHDPGDIVPIAIERNGRPMMLRARLGFR
jgi:hypothetical protein